MWQTTFNLLGMVAIVRLFDVRLSYKTVQISKYIDTERKQSKMFVNREFVEDIRPEDTENTQFEFKNKKSWPALPPLAVLHKKVICL